MQENGTSRWVEITQPRIDAFADATDDWQFIHTDPARARDTPFGGTVAHGFLSLSLLSALFYDAIPFPENSGMSVNYGFDRIRFLAPVPSGARVRGHFALTKTVPAPGHRTFHWSVTVEIDGADKPALTAEWINRLYDKDAPDAA